MNITVFPKKLSGQVTVPPSKSVAHRMVIAAALSNGVSEITNLYPSVDILATMDCMRALGAKIDFDGDKAVIEGIKDIPESAVLDCCESGSYLLLVRLGWILSSSAGAGFHKDLSHHILKSFRNMA